jgi:RND family efflux transporter MFP subunit
MRSVGCRSADLVRSAIALLVVLICTWGCSKEAPDDVESETIVPVTVAQSETGTITAAIHASGLVTPAPGAELIVVAPEPARIAAIPKAEGDVVRRGDLLVQFEIPSAQAEASKQRAEIARAQARLTNARAAQARATDLFDRGVAARKEVEAATREMADAEADLASAQAAATSAERVAERSVVRATFDGVVAKRSHNPGDLVEAAAADAVLRVLDPRRLEVQAAVPIADAPRLKLGAPARLTNVAAGAPAPSLKVASRAVSVEPGTASVPVRLSFTSPANYPVGAPVQIEIDAETRTGVVLVPVDAVVHEGEEAAVFVVTGDTAKRRVVMVGLQSHDRVEITNGVKAGETIIVSGQNGLPDGAKVSVAKPDADTSAEGGTSEK